MVRPLDHITVIQQINFAEREHQNLQTHPELSWLASSEVDKKKKEIERRTAQETKPSERGKIHLHEEKYGGRQKGKKRGGKRQGEKGENIDLEA